MVVRLHFRAHDLGTVLPQYGGPFIGEHNVIAGVGRKVRTSASRGGLSTCGLLQCSIRKRLLRKRGLTAALRIKGPTG